MSVRAASDRCTPLLGRALLAARSGSSGLTVGPSGGWPAHSTAWPLCEARSSSRCSSSDAHRQHWEEQLLQQALHHVPHLGWTPAALQAAARDLHLSPAVTGLLPRREGQLVQHFVQQCNAQLSDRLQQRVQAPDFQALSTQAKLREAIQLRLSMLEPHISTWPQALAVASQPANLGSSLQLLGQLVDDLWAAAGDTATDSSWYSKRALLAGLYTSTELYMVADFSPGFQDTRSALERRLHDLDAVGRWAADVHAVASTPAPMASAGRSDGVGGAVRHGLQQALHEVAAKAAAAVGHGAAFQARQQEHGVEQRR